MTKEQFIDLVSKEQESLRRFLCMLCRGDSAVADDIAQEALLKAYLSCTSFEGRSKFSTWLFRIAYNCFYDERKRHHSCTELLSSDELWTLPPVFSDFDADASFRNQRLYMAIDSLPEKERAVVLLFYMEDKSVKEIASITGMPPVTVRSHLFRARKHLKTSLLRDNI